MDEIMIFHVSHHICSSKVYLSYIVIVFLDLFLLFDTFETFLSNPCCRRIDGFFFYAKLNTIEESIVLLQRVSSYTRQGICLLSPHKGFHSLLRVYKGLSLEIRQNKMIQKVCLERTDKFKLLKLILESRKRERSEIKCRIHTKHPDNFRY